MAHLSTKQHDCCKVALLFWRKSAMKALRAQAMLSGFMQDNGSRNRNVQGL
jgi:hypothetical protein